MAVIENFDQGGAEFAAVVEQAAELARHGFVIQGLGVQGLELALLGLDDAELAALSEVAQSAGPFDLNRIFRTLVKCRGDLDGSALDRYIVENYLFEWCLDPGIPSIEALLQAGPAAHSAGQTQQAANQAQTAGTRTMKLSASLPPKATARPVPTPSVTPTAAPVNTQSRPIAGVATAAQSASAPSAAAHSASAPSAAAHSASASSAAAHSASAPSAAAHSSPNVTTAVNPSAPAAKSPPVLGRWPDTWRQMIDTWKQLKPLQARKFEEAHPLEYSPQRITLAIRDDGFASKTLFGRDEQARVRDQFRELFGFDGTLMIQPKTAVTGPTNGPAEANTEAPPLPDNILAERGRETAGRRDRLIEEARNAPFTKDLLSTLGGKLEGVRIPGSE